MSENKTSMCFSYSNEALFSISIENKPILCHLSKRTKMRSETSKFLLLIDKNRERELNIYTLTRLRTIYCVRSMIIMCL